MRYCSTSVVKSLCLDQNFLSDLPLENSSGLMAFAVFLSIFLPVQWMARWLAVEWVE
jgi:hypothetical protein